MKLVFEHTVKSAASLLLFNSYLEVLNDFKGTHCKVTMTNQTKYKVINKICSVYFSYCWFVFKFVIYSLVVLLVIFFAFSSRITISNIVLDSACPIRYIS